jgi:broad specificity phosphatase PhoE
MARRSPSEAAAAARASRQLWSRATTVWVSPLTRTLQTALIGLQGHPSLVGEQGHGGKGLTLVADAREVKGIGGLDSIGRARGGKALRQLLKDELEDLYGKTASAATAASAVAANAIANAPKPTTAATDGSVVAALLLPELDARDAEDEWWTGAFSSDKKEDVGAGALTPSSPFSTFSPSLQKKIFFFCTQKCHL